VVLEFLWDTFFSLEEQKSLVASGVHGFVSKLGSTVRYYNPVNGENVYICKGVPCSAALIDAAKAQEEESRAAFMVQGGAYKTGKTYGFTTSKEGTLYFKTNAPPKKTLAKGSICIIVTNMEGKYTKLLELGDVLRRGSAPDLDLKATVVMAGPRKIENAVRGCTLIELVLRYMDEERINDMRWFFRAAEARALEELVELGLQHEQQHQELLLMDLLDGFSRSPCEPTYRPAAEGPEADFGAAWSTSGPNDRPGWLEHPGGLLEIGHGGGGFHLDDFHFDNEAPRHRVWLEPFAIADQLVTNAEFAAFQADGGYQRSDLWMSEGWAICQARQWQGPCYWRGDDEFTLAGRQPRQGHAPVRHLSWFEADAYARWCGKRLASEAEWEVACERFGPELGQAFGVLWQWTGSPYRPYPGFTPAPGAVGEYNGKFMSSQFVLRGSGYMTPKCHSGPQRRTYRNFFPPASRWMASGIRLAQQGSQP
jgi:ergothioneine biosynthesis protein EgtB